MIPDRAFAEERKHLKPAPTLNEAVVPRVASVRPTNVVSYLQNRYQVPKGTYYPGREARIEAEESEGVVSFYDAQSGELLASHKIEAKLKGRLVQLPKNADRYKESAYGELKVKVISLFRGYTPASDYVERIIQKYPRYIRDQLSLINKMQEKYQLAALIRGIDYCTERELFSATDLKDTVEYFSREEPKAAQTNVDLPAKYKFVKAAQRPLDYYSAATQPGGGSL